jgi:hypothetical protein
MIKNIPIKFNQNDVLEMINKKFAKKFDYFYLPKDIRTQQGVGFAFINMTSPFYIIDFFLEYHCVKWSEYVENCNSNKICQIIYANMQGIQEIKQELGNKIIMKKSDAPQFFNDTFVDESEISAIIEKYQTYPEYYKSKLEIQKEVIS